MKTNGGFFLMTWGAIVCCEAVRGTFAYQLSFVPVLMAGLYLIGQGYRRIEASWEIEEGGDG